MATILIVDDHILNREFLIALLGFDKHILLAASDGVEGLRVACAQRPDLIITDLLMPNMNGVEFVTRMRAEPGLADTPVIFYSATYGTCEALAMARNCGVRSVLKKPAAPEQILAEVHEALGLPPVCRDADEAPAPQAGGRSPIDTKLGEYLHELEASRALMEQLAGDAAQAGPAQLRHLTGRLSQSLADLQNVGLRLSALIDMGIEMGVERDPARLLETGCRVAQQIGVARYAVVGIVGADGGAPRRVALRGVDGDLRARLATMPANAGVLGTLMARRQPLRLAGLDGDARKLGLPAGHPPVHSFLAVPVATAAGCYGWIYLVDKLGAGEFSEVDERAVATVASQMAVSYENLGLYDKISEHLAQLESDLAERRQLQEALAERAAGLQRAQLIAGMAHIVTGPGGAFESWSATLPLLLGLAPGALPPDNRSWLALVEAPDRARFRDTCIAAGVSGQRSDIDYRLRRGDGSVVHLRHVLEPLEPQGGGGGGRNVRWFNTIQDVTEQKEQQQRIARMGQIYATVSGINSAIVRIRDRDELLQEACRVAVSQGAFGMAWAGVLDPDSGAGRVVASAGGKPGYAGLIRFSARADGAGADRPASIAAREGRRVICDDISAEPSMAPVLQELLSLGQHAVAALPLTVESRVVAVISLTADEIGFFSQPDRLKLLEELAGDLSFGLQFIEKEDRLNYLAYYDALTGLPNGMLFNDRLAQFLNSAGGAEVVAAAVINIDHFVQLNETLGRHNGDEVLKLVGQRLAEVLREPFSLARIGGDTFAIAFGGLQQGAAAAGLLEQYVLQPLSQPFVVARQEVRLSVRAGVALYPADGGDAESLFKHAEVALKKAKSSNERYLFYAPQMNSAIAAKIALEQALREALATGQFVMHYQPRVDLLSGRVVSAEALMRWQHPLRGMVPPLEFIPAAEENGLIVPIGDWAIEAVCAQQAAWREQGIRIVPVAINLSALQFKRGNVKETIRAALARHSLEPRHIEFELTESVVMDNPEHAIGHLQELKGLGVQLSLDDFGTGYSSLAYLKRFPFDFVKIDRAFITDVTNNAEDAAIVKAVIAMAHSLGLRVVAEGVEKEGQLEFLRRQRCDELQGYYFSRPVAGADFGAMLREDRRLALASLPDRRTDTLLIVDDEPAILSALQRVFRHEGIRLLTAGGGPEALELLALHPVQVILTDQRMSGMSGSAFLGIVKDLYPNTVRIILSGHADFDAISEGLNEGAIYKFLTKPWDDDGLREHVRDAFRRYRPRP